jgi:hypothetical protein
MIYEFPIEVAKADELSDIFHGLGCGPSFDAIEFDRVHLDRVWSYDNAEVF